MELTAIQAGELRNFWYIGVDIAAIYGAFSMKNTSKFPTEDEVRNKIEKLKSVDWPPLNPTAYSNY